MPLKIDKCVERCDERWWKHPLFCFFFCFDYPMANDKRVYCNDLSTQIKLTESRCLCCTISQLISSFTHTGTYYLDTSIVLQPLWLSRTHKLLERCQQLASQIHMRILICSFSTHTWIVHGCSFNSTFVHVLFFSPDNLVSE